MEAKNNVTAIQIATANKYFAKERNKHAEMSCYVSNNGECLFFIGHPQKKSLGKHIAVCIIFIRNITK